MAESPAIQASSQAEMKRKALETNQRPTGASNQCKVGAAILLLLMAATIGYLTYTCLFTGSSPATPPSEQQRSPVNVHNLNEPPAQASVQQVSELNNELAETPTPSQAATPQVEAPVAQSESPPPPQVETPSTPLEQELKETLKPDPAVTPEPEPEAWRSFKITFKRNYTTPEEEARRRAVFLDNLHFIETHNKQGEKYTLAVNHLADMTRDEINDLVIGPQMSWPQTIGQLTEPIPPPMKILSEGEQPSDWRQATGEPVASFPCRASAVFAAVANVEAALSIQSGRPPVKLSEAQLINCLTLGAPPNSLPVCAGFVNMLHAYELLRRLEAGLATAQAFGELSVRLPPNQLVCALPPGDQVRARLGGVAYVHRDNLPEALASGPLTVALDASQSTFHFYHSGLYQDPACSRETYNLHALLVGATPEGYLLRTSLGPAWGEHGQVRLARRDDNRCLPQEMGIQPQMALAPPSL